MLNEGLTWVDTVPSSTSITARPPHPRLTPRRTLPVFHAVRIVTNSQGTVILHRFTVCPIHPERDFPPFFAHILPSFRPENIRLKRRLLSRSGTGNRPRRRQRLTAVTYPLKHASLCHSTRVTQELHTSLHTPDSLVESRFFDVVFGNRVTV